MDWQTIQPFFDWLSENPSWAGFFVLIIAMSESLLIVGLIVPGTVLMFGVGTLVGTGVLALKETLIVAFIGAVMGDGISFWIGAKFKDRIERLWPFHKKPQYLEHGKRFFHKHGGKSILIGRFVGPVRPIIPAVAGMMGMKPGHFFLVNIISAAGWAPFYLLPGVVFGTSIGLAMAVGTRLAIVFIALITGIVIVLWLTKHLYRFAVPRLDSVFRRLYQWASKHQKMGEYVIAVIDEKAAEKHGLTFFILMLFCLPLLFILFVSQLGSEYLGLINQLSENMVHFVRSEIADRFMVWIMAFFTWHGLLLLMFNGLVVLLINRKKQALFHLVGLLVVSVAMVVVVNLFNNAILGVDFANVQLVAYFEFIMFVSIIIAETYDIQRRWLIYSVALVLSLLLLSSKIYLLQVSFLDAFASVLTAIVWTALFGIAYRRHESIQLGNNSLIISTVLFFVLMGTLSVKNNFERDLHTARISPSENLVSYNQWLSSEWRELDVERVNVLGKMKQNFNIQWAGDLDSIREMLLGQGWQLPNSLNLKTLLYWLKPDVKIAELARLPQTHHGETETLVLNKTESQQRYQWVIQFWHSHHIISEIEKPVWLVFLSRQSIDPQYKLLAQPEVNSVSVEEVFGQIEFAPQWQSSIVENVLNMKVALIGPSNGIAPQK